MANTVQKNYTDEMVATLVSGYTTKEGTNKEFVTEIAKELGRSTKSIVAKLVSLNLYVTEAKVTKTGLPVVSKGVLVGQIEDHFGFSLPSLVKATKVDLQTLVDNLGYTPPPLRRGTPRTRVYKKPTSATL